MQTSLPFLDPQKPTMGSQQHYRYIFQRIHANTNSRALDRCDVYSHKMGPLSGLDGKSSQVQSSTPRPAPKRKVRFEEDSNSYHENTMLCMQDTQELWYTQDDLRIFKKEAGRFVKDLVLVEKAQDETMTFRKVFQQVYDACCDSTVEENSSHLIVGDAQLHMLALWMSIAEDRWGLERPSVRQVHFDRSCRRKTIKVQVLQVQSMVQHLESRQVKAECLCKAAQAISRPSRLFARLLAQAQESALHHQ